MVGVSSSFSDDAGSPLLSSSNLSSQPKTFANVFIAIVGAGVLGLPYTFMRTGWASGVILLLSVGALCTYCMMLLVKIRRRLSLSLSDPSEITSFGDLALAVSGPIGRLTVDALLIISQAGFCVGYLIFISNTLTHLLRHPSAKPLSVLAMLPFQLALNSIPSLTHLAPLSIFADIVDAAAMGLVLSQEASILIHRPPPSLTAFGPLSALPSAIGVAVYSFEGVGMVLPLESEAANKPTFGRVLSLSMGFISSTYALFGAMGYLAFGSDTRDIVTTNLGAGALSLAVQLGLAINLFFTFPIMMNPVYEIAERLVSGKQYCLWLRWAAVAVVSAVALFVPNFNDFLALVGSSVCCMLAFVLPAAFHLKLFGPEMGRAAVAVDVAIVAIGVGFAISGTYSSLMHLFFSVEL